MYKKSIVILLFSFNLSADTALASDGEDFTTLIALFGLGIISLFALFLSSEKIKYFKKKYKEKEVIEDNIKKSEDEMLSKLGESIHTLAKDNVNTHPNTTKSENQLLAITTNLIDFLKIKSKKVQISNDKIKLSNLLNDVSGTLKSNIKGKELELIYDIKDDISETLTSDTLNMSKILVNVLLYCVENNSKIIKLQIAKNSLVSRNDQLFFTIQSNVKIDAEHGVNIFKSNYNEKTEEYDSLGLFIARELSLLMKGDLISRNDESGNLEFIFNIPYFEEKQEEVKKSIKNKNILVIDSVEESAIGIKKILKSLGHVVKILDPEDFLSNLDYFDMYEFLFLDEKLFTNKAISKLDNTNIKIIAISNIFKTSENFPNSESADLKIFKPLTIWQVEDALDSVNNHDFNLITDDSNKIINSGNVLVHRNTFQETRNISLSDFEKFSGKRVLLVEDNVINQKVFTGVLRKSQMDISVANHGKEALKMISNEEKFDIIFMDINMPIVDGYTASIKIREDSKNDDIAIIALSALTSNNEVAKMFVSGMNGYLPKPLRKEMLFSVFSIYIESTKHVEAQEVKKEVKKPVDIYGLNVALGISKSSSSKIFYKEILREFKDAYGEVDITLEKLVKDFRYEQLKILSVDLKGLTGTIGAEYLNRIITLILQKISIKKYDDIPSLLVSFKEELQLLNNSIDKYLGTNN